MSETDHSRNSSTSTAYTTSPTDSCFSPDLNESFDGVSIPPGFTHQYSYPKRPHRPSSSLKTRYDHLVPPNHDWRTLVLCFDGTGDQFDADNSNIVKFFSMLKKNDRTHQMVYYQAGIGTYTVPQVATPGMASFSKTVDEMIAWNLDAHVMGGYEFLMEHYLGGDKICIFGFSRGAYTARALAGMIHKVGLLPAGNHQQVAFAYKMYTTEDEAGWKQSNAFKKAFSMDVDIEFVGVWDTVCSVGIIPHRLPFTKSNTAIRTFRHAVSLDERRARFKANHWNRPSEAEVQLGVPAHERPRTQRAEKAKLEILEHHSTNEKIKRERVNKQLEALEEEYNDRMKSSDVLEVWFAGCHCDVGGGSVDNGVRHSLARIPLRWMIRQCFLCNTGIMFDADLLKTIGLRADILYPEVLVRPEPLTRLPSGVSLESLTEIVDEDLENVNHGLEHDKNPHKTNEEEEDLADALCPLYDQLSLAWPWWILEVIPQKQRFQKEDHTWAHYFSVNMGRGRIIPKLDTQRVKVHRTVKLRMDAEGLPGGKYIPKANLDLNNVEWVD